MKKLILAVAANCVLGLTLPAQTVPEPAKELDNYLANLVAENKLLSPSRNAVVSPSFQ